MPRYPTRQVAQRQQEIFAEQIRDHYDPEVHEDDGAEEADEEPKKKKKKKKKRRRIPKKSRPSQPSNAEP